MSKEVEFDFSLIDLVLLPVSLPLKMAGLAVGRLADIVHEELYDEQKLYKNLMDLELRFEMGEVSAEEYTRQNDTLMSRLRTAKELRRNEQAESR